MIAPKDHTLSEFLAEQVAQHNAFTLLQGLAVWLRQRKGKRAEHRVNLLIATLQQNPDLCQKTAELLAKWLGSLRLYPLLISAGIFSRKGFRDELIARLYEHFNPAYKDPNDLRDVFALLLVNERDARWLREIPEQTWLQLFHLIWQKTPVNQRDTLRRYVRWEGFHAIEMLSIWIAAEALEPDLVRLDPKLLDRDSAFVAFKRETHAWLAAHVQHQTFDDSHLQVMLQQCPRSPARSPAPPPSSKACRACGNAAWACSPAASRKTPATTANTTSRAAKKNTWAWCVPPRAAAC